ncbi:MAG: hypothetical protein Q8S43_00925 [Actinomycetota bacterium]|nr:MAG: hypothetical protein FD171_108 [Actinomycetota bacterium]MDO8950640.1 hypothetical protein [Actinomycetota bacterium]MDP3629502.1 hypothetical protein [Actinomycetota bacterium]
MATWVYRCGDCAMTFAVDVESGADAPETVSCSSCDGGEAVKAFMLPELNPGGCGCGGGGCGGNGNGGGNGDGSGSCAC